ncbi:hypothetical protein C7415_101199 [Cupriavidus alkaliphilus]|nr:hypothetical protein [Cupriavidus alkaliphilus]RAS12165.1 hypothetical protein C7415_101199 [Cupriavidus alkaliphilus]
MHRMAAAFARACHDNAEAHFRAPCIQAESRRRLWLQGAPHKGFRDMPGAAASALARRLAFATFLSGNAAPAAGALIRQSGPHRQKAPGMARSRPAAANTSPWPGHRLMLSDEAARSFRQPRVDTHAARSRTCVACAGMGLRVPRFHPATKPRRNAACRPASPAPSAQRHPQTLAGQRFARPWPAVCLCQASGSAVLVAAMPAQRSPPSKPRTIRGASPCQSCANLQCHTGIPATLPPPGAAAARRSAAWRARATYSMPRGACMRRRYAGCSHATRASSTAAPAGGRSMRAQSAPRPAAGFPGADIRCHQALSQFRSPAVLVPNPRSLSCKT